MASAALRTALAPLVSLTILTAFPFRPFAMRRIDAPVSHGRVGGHPDDALASSCCL
jgi:hypothetical protein